MLRLHRAALASAIFRRCLKFDRVLHPVWLTRKHDLIKTVDALGRQRDIYDFRVCPFVFWQANDMASLLWGCGFQVDRAATWNNVVPVDRGARLPFNSFRPQPYASGLNMLHQDWSRLVNWCYPPLPLVGRVIRLLQQQCARAALFVPAKTAAWWFPRTQMGALGVRAVLFFPKVLRPCMHNGADGLRRLSTDMRVVFFDFSQDVVPICTSVMSAEKLSPQLLTQQTPNCPVFHSLPPEFVSNNYLATSRPAKKGAAGYPRVVC